MPKYHDPRAPKFAPDCRSAVVWYITEAQELGFLPVMERASLSTWRVTLNPTSRAPAGSALVTASAQHMEEAFLYAITAALRDPSWRPPAELRLPEPEQSAVDRRQPIDPEKVPMGDGSRPQAPEPEGGEVDFPL